MEVSWSSTAVACGKEWQKHILKSRFVRYERDLPHRDLCLFTPQQEFAALGGRFTMSDDSPGIEQVGLNYDKTLACVKQAGIFELWYLAPASANVSQGDSRFPGIGWKNTSVAELERHLFWQK